MYILQHYKEAESSQVDEINNVIKMFMFKV